MIPIIPIVIIPIPIAEVVLIQSPIIMSANMTRSINAVGFAITEKAKNTAEIIR